MKSEPLVSILLPVCNASPFLKQAVTSLLRQSYKNIEIIAIDDFSKDNSYTILKAYKKQDRRLRAYRNKKRYTLSICLNRALRQAKGTFIAFMDPNDIATRDRIKRQVAFLLHNPHVAAVGTQTILIDENGKKLAKTTLPHDHQTIVHTLLSGTSLQFETTMIHRLLLPKDLLHFKHAVYPFVFSDLFMKMLPYGELTNLPWALHYRRKLNDASSQVLKLFPPVIKIWITSFTTDYRLPIRSLFSPLVRQA